jgi:hypothetical protein
MPSGSPVLGLDGVYLIVALGVKRNIFFISKQRQCPMKYGVFMYSHRPHKVAAAVRTKIYFIEAGAGLADISRDTCL